MFESYPFFTSGKSSKIARINGEVVVEFKHGFGARLSTAVALNLLVLATLDLQSARIAYASPHIRSFAVVDFVPEKFEKH